MGDGSINLAKTYAKAQGDRYAMPNQYENEANVEAHLATTGPEIWRQTDGTIGAYVAGVGTGGTICGAGRYLKEQNPDILVVGVDPEGSIYTAPTEADVRSYLIEGVGEDFWPETFDPSVIDRYEMVTDRDAFVMTRRLAEVEGVLVGGSCGMAAVGALRIAEERPDLLVVVILPDGGRNYLSKIFNDDWMAAHGFLD
jgi:cystathionine beta-synthase